MSKKNKEKRLGNPGIAPVGKIRIRDRKTIKTPKPLVSNVLIISPKDVLSEDNLSDTKSSIYVRFCFFGIVVSLICFMNQGLIQLKHVYSPLMEHHHLFQQQAQFHHKHLLLRYDF